MYTIGNQKIEILKNTLTIGDNKFETTNGLLELLTKKSPNWTLIKENDKQIYNHILINSNAIYQKFDSKSKRLNSDESEKWKFIRNELQSTLKIAELKGPEKFSAILSVPLF